MWVKSLFVSGGSQLPLLSGLVKSQVQSAQVDEGLLEVLQSVEERGTRRLECT